MAQLFQEVEWLGVIKGKFYMIEIYEVIREYENKTISLEELQEFIWGLTESTLETIAEDKLVYYLSSGYK